MRIVLEHILGRRLRTLGGSLLVLCFAACGARSSLYELTAGASGRGPADASVAGSASSGGRGGSSGASPVGGGAGAGGGTEPRDASVDAPDSRDAGATCTNTCIEGNQECNAGGISQCVADAMSCFGWIEPVPCPSGQACQASDGQAICTPIAQPRPIAPLSTATVTSHTPIFHWQLASGTDGAQVEVYRDRTCTKLVQTFSASGSSGMPKTALAAGLYYWRLRGAVGSVVGQSTSAVWQFFVGAQSAPVNASWGTVPDLNGDGFADLVIGTPDVNGLNGAVQIHYGTPNGPAATATTLTGPATTVPFPAFGTSVASAGDVNGDGFADLVVGASSSNASAGAAYVYPRSRNGISMAPTVLTGPASVLVSLGWTVSSAGDVNGDGFGDVVVGEAAGSANLYLGSANGLSTTPIALGSFRCGTAAAGVGDLNGDGFGDVALGCFNADNDAGALYVFMGSPQGLPATPIEIDNPTGQFGFFGMSVASAGDVNGDGFADIVVGAPGIVPLVYVYLGSATGLQKTPISLPSQGGPTDDLDSPYSLEFGASVSGAGDVNGDGFDDIAVGSPGAAAAYLYLGNPSGLATVAIVLPNGSLQYGSTVAGVGDLNGDGFADVVVGSDAVGFRDNPGLSAIFFGAASGPTLPARIISDPGAVLSLAITDALQMRGHG